MSGHTCNSFVHHEWLDPGLELILKPLHIKAWRQRVRRVLDSQWTLFILMEYHKGTPPEL